MAEKDPKSTASLVADESRASLVADDDADQVDVPAVRTAISSNPKGLDQIVVRRLGVHELGTADILGLDEAVLLAGGASEQELQGRVKQFWARYNKTCEKDLWLQRNAQTEVPYFKVWIAQIGTLSRSSSVTPELRKMVEEERVARDLQNLRDDLRTYLRDRKLDWHEHQSMLRAARDCGLNEKHVEQLYQEWIAKNGGVAPEGYPPVEPPQATRTVGWSPHMKLAEPGETEGWNVSRLQDALMQKFFIAEDCANQDFELRSSLYGYLDERGDASREMALKGRAAAQDTRCRALAVWYYLWSTGRTALHFGGKGFWPVRDRRKQIQDLASLRELVAESDVRDELGKMIEAGLLQYWLVIVCHVDAHVFELAETLRRASAAKTDSTRPRFLRVAALRVLWAAGIEGLPLVGEDGSRVVARDSKDMIKASESCWASLRDHLQDGALTLWLEHVDPQRARFLQTIAASVT